MEEESLHKKYLGWLDFHGREMMRTNYPPGAENSAPAVDGPYRTPELRDQAVTKLLKHISMLAGALEYVALDLAKEVQAMKDSHSSGSGK